MYLPYNRARFAVTPAERSLFPMADGGASWFARLFGAEETEYEATRALFSLQIDGTLEYLVAPNGHRFCAGSFETPSLEELRALGTGNDDDDGSLPVLQVENVVGDVGEMHALPEAKGSVFQVASQFNCLEVQPTACALVV